VRKGHELRNDKLKLIRRDHMENTGTKIECGKEIT
jgi:hypothetical protein